MLPAEQARGEALVALARTHFDAVLEPIEEQVLRHSCAYEDPADWPPDPATPDPTRHETTGRPLPGSPLPAIRPTLIRWLLTTPDATALLEPRGLRVWNTRLTEPLDLIGCTTSARLELRYCLVEASIFLANASLPTLSLRNSTLQQTLDAPFLKLHGPLLLDDITAADTLNFNAAIIPADVSISNTTLTATGNTFSMAGASITNDLVLCPNLRSAGTLFLSGINVEGFVELNGAQLTTKDNTALNLNGAIIRGNLGLIENFESSGELTLICAEIGGQLNCNGAKLTATGNALYLESSKINGGIYLIDGFESAGGIRLHGSEIGDVLDCVGAKLTTRGDALSLDNATIDGSVFLRDGFESAGTIRLHGAHVVGQLNCQGASIHSLICENMDVKADFFWRQIMNPEQASLNLMGAKIKSIYDDHGSWPTKGNLELNGLHVDDLYPLHAHGLDITGRIAWLNRQPNSQIAEPQPWLHLAAHFEAKGHKRAAKRVIYELRKHQSRANWKNSRFKRLGYLWDTRFGRLEQQPFFILVPILLLTALSGTTFHAYRAHFAETSESAYKTTHIPNPQAAPSYPKFQPFVYALENVLPVIKLGQDDKWAPDPAHTSSALYRTLVVLRWLLILSGWVMGGILAAAVSARFRS